MQLSCPLTLDRPHQLLVTRRREEPLGLCYSCWVHAFHFMQVSVKSPSAEWPPVPSSSFTCHYIHDTTCFSVLPELLPVCLSVCLQSVSPATTDPLNYPLYPHPERHCTWGGLLLNDGVTQREILVCGQQAQDWTQPVEDPSVQFREAAGLSLTTWGCATPA